MIKNIGFFPRFVIENIVFENNYGIISITDPQQQPAKLQGTDNVLRLSFLDLTPEHSPDLFNLFTDKQATEILHFVNSLKNVDKLIIHCEAGISRSAAVALCLSEYLGCEFNQKDKADLANPYVVKIMQKYINKPIVIPDSPKEITIDLSMTHENINKKLF